MAYGFFFRLKFFFMHGFWPRNYHVQMLRDLDKRARYYEDTTKDTRNSS